MGSPHRAVPSSSAIAIVLLAVALTPVAAASETEQRSERVPVLSRHDGSVGPVIGRWLADLNGDRLDDGLAAIIGRSAPDERLDVIVVHDRTVDVAAARRVAGSFRVTRRFRLLDGFAAALRPTQVRAIARLPGVARVERDARVQLLMDGVDTDVGAEAARATFGASGAGVGICIIDTGLARWHEQFGGTTRTFRWRDFVAGKTSFYDDNGHGTHVASIAAGDGQGGALAAGYGGIAPRADLAIAKVLNRNGAGAESRVIAGIEWCVQQPGVRVLSMSLGLPLPSDGLDAMSRAVDAAQAAGKVVVVAAGNEGDTPGSVGSPASAAGAITVGATAEWSSPLGAVNRSEGLYLAPWSSRGPTLDGRVKPDLVAPGVTVTAAQRATTSGYITYSGTSMATPVVAGAAALLLQANPAWTPADVRAALTSTTVDLGPPGPDHEYGAGALDVFAALAVAEGETGAWSFPTLRQREGEVGPSSTWSMTFDLAATDLAQPIAATVIAEGACVVFDPLAYRGCQDPSWSIDLDARLLDPAGVALDVSVCPSGPDCMRGRQETLHAMPTVPGTYTLEVTAAAGTGGGAFRVDVSTGPLGPGPPLPPAPSVHVGDLDATRWKESSTSWRARVAITVHDESERAVAGVTVAGSWTGGISASCTTNLQGICFIPRSWPTSQAQVTFAVVSLAAAGRVDEATANHDPETDSNGTSITIARP